MRLARVLLALFPAILLAQGHRGCAIQGTVLDALTMQTLAKAKVFAQQETDDENGSLPVRRIPDASGQFCFEQLTPGDYRVFAERVGYLDANYGEPRPGARDLSKDVEVDREKTQQSLLIKMTPQDVITGSLIDAEGDPIANAPVSLLRRRWAQGKTFPSHVDAIRTDEQGRFRLSRIPPGIYYLSALPSNLNLIGSVNDLLDGQGQPIREQEVETFYKGSLSFAGAIAIPVKAGQELDGFILTREKILGHRLSGHLPAELTSSNRTLVATQSMDTGPRIFTIVVENDGSFHSDALPAGQYVLTLRTAGKEFRADVDLTEGDVDGVVWIYYSWVPFLILTHRAGFLHDPRER